MGSFDSRSFSQQSLAVDPSFTNAEYNTPEMFKQNMQIALELLARVQALARSALVGIEHAYRPGNNPMQTSADIAALRQAHQTLVEHLRASGVGALPLLTSPSPELPSEQRLMDETTKAVQVLYDRQKRLQESAATVANLLSTPDTSQLNTRKRERE
ncbi:hypothetical protein BXZ70DRAFT_895643 [Cristinia sonorae]|uniref:Uncharacterized protein n=1 Tax=Cristinia sonorae TaxID=1940300 RepID=A0A8K0UKS9_9AGAR|nr:hypothetical protein BXZ70DRAFT_895643 [Cristinia sonorae]